MFLKVQTVKHLNSSNQDWQSDNKEKYKKRDWATAQRQENL